MITLRVPGRLEVFGKHTDYGGGRSLVCAVPRGITMTADQTTDGRVVIVDLATNDQAVFSSAGRAAIHGIAGIEPRGSPRVSSSRATCRRLRE